MVKYYYKNIKSSSIRVLQSYKKGCLVTLFEPTEKQLLRVTNSLKLEIDLLQDGRDLFEVPRVEVENDIVYVFTRFPKDNSTKIATSTALFVLARDYTLLLAQENKEFFKEFLCSSITTTQKTKLLISFLNYINQSYRSKIIKYAREIRLSSKEIEDLDNKDITRFVNIEKDLNDYVSSLTSINNFLQKILNKNLVDLYEEDEDLIEDLELTTQELIELGKSNLKYLVNVRESYNTILNNNLNKVIKFLTALTLIFTVPTFIASFYGMNVELPFMHNPFAWVFIIVGITAITLSTIWILIKNKLM